MLATATRSKRITKDVDSTFVIAAFRTKLGWMAAQFVDEKLVRLTFGQHSRSDALAAIDAKSPDGKISPGIAATIERLTAYSAGEGDELMEIDVAYPIGVTPFQRRVLEACRAIPAGETLSYAQLAVIAGAPGAARAVGNVMRTNRIPLVIPCHRVVGSGGYLGGYSAPEGLAMKRRLLEREGVSVR